MFYSVLFLLNNAFRYVSLSRIHIFFLIHVFFTESNANEIFFHILDTIPPRLYLAYMYVVLKNTLK